jgi:hypothetical protein
MEKDGAQMSELFESGKRKEVRGHEQSCKGIVGSVDSAGWYGDGVWGRFSDARE